MTLKAFIIVDSLFARRDESEDHRARVRIPSTDMARNPDSVLTTFEVAQ